MYIKKNLKVVSGIHFYKKHFLKNNNMLRHIKQPQPHKVYEVLPKIDHDL
jgi:hypothetical protein